MKKKTCTSDSTEDRRQMRRQKSEEIFVIDRLTECSCIMHPGPAALAHKGNAGLTCKSFTTTRPVYSPWMRTLLTGGGWPAAKHQKRKLLLHRQLSSPANSWWKWSFKRQRMWKKKCVYFVCNQWELQPREGTFGSVLAVRLDELHLDTPSVSCHRFYFSGCSDPAETKLLN